MVRVRSTAHFLVLMMGVSPTAFSSTSTAGRSASHRPAPRRSLAHSARPRRPLAPVPAGHRARPPRRRPLSPLLFFFASPAGSSVPGDPAGGGPCSGGPATAPPSGVSSPPSLRPALCAAADGGCSSGSAMMQLLRGRREVTPRAGIVPGGKPSSRHVTLRERHVRRAPSRGDVVRAPRPDSGTGWAGPGAGGKRKGKSRRRKRKGRGIQHSSSGCRLRPPPHHDQSHPHLQQPRQAAALQVLPALCTGGPGGAGSAGRGPGGVGVPSLALPLGPGQRRGERSGAGTVCVRLPGEPGLFYWDLLFRRSEGAGGGRDPVPRQAGHSQLCVEALLQALLSGCAAGLCHGGDGRAGKMVLERNSFL